MTNPEPSRGRAASLCSLAELEAYLDESLPAGQMAAIEELLRDHAGLRQQLVAINGRRDAGLHSLGETWRRHRLSCPAREQLGSYLLGVLAPDVGDYIRFHVETVECRYCQASLDDLRTQQSEQDQADRENRRQRYFQSSAGHLRSSKK